jgi:hypothetical protein
VPEPRAIANAAKKFTALLVILEEFIFANHSDKRVGVKLAKSLAYDGSDPALVEARCDVEQASEHNNTTLSNSSDLLFGIEAAERGLARAPSRCDDVLLRHCEVVERPRC